MSLFCPPWPPKATSVRPGFRVGCLKLLFVTAAALSVFACRAYNPAYRQGDELLQHSATSRSSASHSGGGGELTDSTTNSTSQVSLAPASTPQGDKTGTSEDQSASSSPRFESSTSISLSGANSSSSTGIEILTSCSYGMPLCYPVLLNEDESTGYVKDHGSRGLDLWLGAHAGMVGGLGKDLPGIFQKTMYTTHQGPGITSSQAYKVKSDHLGVDVWIKPDEDVANFTIVEIRGVLAIYRDAEKFLNCIYQDGGEPVKVRVELKVFDKFAHLQCSLKGGVLSLSLNGAAPKTAEYERSVKSTEGTLSVGRAGALSPAGKMKGRVALLRVWEDLEQMQDALRAELPYYCKLFKLC